MNRKVKLKYVIITPAHNEEAFIEKTILSMINQTILPKKWVIVSDGSTDGTDNIIKKYSKTYKWIEYVRRPKHLDRQFAAKVYAFNAGFEKIRSLDYDVIGNLDADLSFEPDYLEFLLKKFMENPELGVAGTPFVEDSTDHYDYKYSNIEHVSGACQLFKRECFEDIGGYIPIKGGGIDWIAVTTARMKGWKTRTFTGKTIFHHRKMGTGKGNVLAARFRLGKEDYYLGSHPLWEFFRVLYQMKSKPLILSGLCLLLGYTTAILQRHKRPISHELVKFYRKEQMKRLQRTLLKKKKL